MKSDLYGAMNTSGSLGEPAIHHTGVVNTCEESNLDHIRNSYDNRSGFPGSLRTTLLLAALFVFTLGGGVFSDGDRRDALFLLMAASGLLFVASALLWMRARDRHYDELDRSASADLRTRERGR